MSHYMFSYDEIYNLIYTLYDKNFELKFIMMTIIMSFTVGITKKGKILGFWERETLVGAIHYFRKNKDTD